MHMELKQEQRDDTESQSVAKCATKDTFCNGEIVFNTGPDCLQVGHRQCSLKPLPGGLEGTSLRNFSGHLEAFSLSEQSQAFAQIGCCMAQAILTGVDKEEAPCLAAAWLLRVAPRTSCSPVQIAFATHPTHHQDPQSALLPDKSAWLDTNICCKPERTRSHMQGIRVSWCM